MVAKNIWLIISTIALVIIVIATLGSMVGFAVGALLIYFGYRQANIQASTWMKVLWWSILIIGVLVGLGSIPGLIGFGALYLLIKIYERWKHTEDVDYLGANI